MNRRDIAEKKCSEPLELTPAAQQSFAARQRWLIDNHCDARLGGKPWPLAGWYNDEDFCRAYNTACMLGGEVDRLTDELARQSAACANERQGSCRGFKAAERGE